MQTPDPVPPTRHLDRSVTLPGHPVVTRATVTWCLEKSNVSRRRLVGMDITWPSARITWHDPAVPLATQVRFSYYLIEFGCSQDTVMPHVGWPGERSGLQCAITFRHFGIFSELTHIPGALSAGPALPSLQVETDNTSQLDGYITYNLICEVAHYRTLRKGDAASGYLHFNQIKLAIKSTQTKGEYGTLFLFFIPWLNFFIARQCWARILCFYLIYRDLEIRKKWNYWNYWLKKTNLRQSTDICINNMTLRTSVNYFTTLQNH